MPPKQLSEVAKLYYNWLVKQNINQIKRQFNMVKGLTQKTTEPLNKKLEIINALLDLPQQSITKRLSSLSLLPKQKENCSALSDPENDSKSHQMKTQLSANKKTSTISEHFNPYNLYNYFDRSEVMWIQKFDRDEKKILSNILQRKFMQGHRDQHQRRQQDLVSSLKQIKDEFQHGKEKLDSSVKADLQNLTEGSTKQLEKSIFKLVIKNKDLQSEYLPVLKVQQLIEPTLNLYFRTNEATILPKRDRNHLFQSLKYNILSLRFRTVQELKPFQNQYLLIKDELSNQIDISHFPIPAKHTLKGDQITDFATILHHYYGYLQLKALRKESYLQKVILHVQENITTEIGYLVQGMTQEYQEHQSLYHRTFGIVLSNDKITKLLILLQSHHLLEELNPTNKINFLSMCIGICRTVLERYVVLILDYDTHKQNQSKISDLFKVVQNCLQTLDLCENKLFSVSIQQFETLPKIAQCLMNYIHTVSFLERNPEVLFNIQSSADHQFKEKLELGLESQATDTKQLLVRKEKLTAYLISFTQRFTEEIQEENRQNYDVVGTKKQKQILSILEVLVRIYTFDQFYFKCFRDNASDQFLYDTFKILQKESRMHQIVKRNLSDAFDLRQNPTVSSPSQTLKGHFCGKLQAELGSEFYQKYNQLLEVKNNLSWSDQFQLDQQIRKQSVSLNRKFYEESFKELQKQKKLNSQGATFKASEKRPSKRKLIESTLSQYISLL